MSLTSVKQLKTVKKNVRKHVDAALEETGGLLRLAPAWVPRSFLQPGLRLKLHPDDTYAYGLNRGGIDERWFGSTTEAANEGRVPDEGLSYVVHGRSRFTLREAVAECGADIIGKRIWKKYGKWPVYSKFFDNMGPIPHHMHQNAKQAKLVGQEGKPESYYFPPQHNNVGNNFPYTFMGLEPGTTKAQVRQCLADWNKGDNGILDLSRAYRLKPGTGWLIPPCILHAPGSLCTYEPQWGSDVFGMYQNLVEGREVPWSLLVKDMPKKKHRDLDFIVNQLDWAGNTNENFKDSHYLEPIPVADTRKQGYVDRWIVYGRIKRGAAFHSQGTHRRSRCNMHRERQGCLERHLRAGQRHHQRPAAQQPQAHPLPRVDRGRILLHRGRRQGRCHLREHQRHRTLGTPPLLRPRGESRRPRHRRLSKTKVRLRKSN